GQGLMHRPAGRTPTALRPARSRFLRGLGVERGYLLAHAPGAAPRTLRTSALVLGDRHGEREFSIALPAAVLVGRHPDRMFRAGGTRRQRTSAEVAHVVEHA